MTVDDFHIKIKSGLISQGMNATPGLKIEIKHGDYEHLSIIRLTYSELLSVALLDEVQKIIATHLAVIKLKNFKLISLKDGTYKKEGIK